MVPSAVGQHRPGRSAHPSYFSHFASSIVVGSVILQQFSISPLFVGQHAPGRPAAAHPGFSLHIA